LTHSSFGRFVRIGRLASYGAKHPFECLHIGDVEFPLLAEICCQHADHQALLYWFVRMAYTQTRVWFGRIKPPRTGLPSASIKRTLRIVTVGTKRAIEEWNAQWTNVAGRAACSSCMKSQALGDYESPFLHAETCPANDFEGHHPWVALHHILDDARG
jgi:hypothetical protein